MGEEVFKSNFGFGHRSKVNSSFGTTKIYITKEKRSANHNREGLFLAKLCLWCSNSRANFESIEIELAG